MHVVVEHEPIVLLTLQIHYLSDEAYSSIIYDHYLFDVPKLMDLCVLYGRANQAALGTMLTSIFERQPKYIEDLANAAKGLVQVSKLSHTHTVYMYGMCMTMRVCMCVCVFVCVCVCVCVLCVYSMYVLVCGLCMFFACAHLCV